MAELLNPSTCARCNVEFAYGEKVVPVWQVVHKGRVHTEVAPTRQMAHVECPAISPVKPEGER